MNRSNNNDVALIADCQRGDRHAMATLVTQYHRPVFNVVYRIVGNVDDAADVTQTVFLKVFENLASYDANYKLFSWIYRIAINQAINQNNKRRPVEMLVDDAASAEPGPAEQLDASRLSSTIQSALLQINVEHRTVLILKHMSGYSYKEISAILDLPEKTVKSRLYSARQSMKLLLNETDERS